MKFWFSSKRPAPSDLPVAEAAGWKFGPADVAIAGGTLMLSLAVAMPVAMQYRQETTNLDKKREAVAVRCRQMRSTAEMLEAKRLSNAQLRRAADRYVAEAENRPMVPWTAAVSELSQRRPAGVWTTRISGNGPRFSTEIRALRPELAAAYAQSLKQSSYVEFAEQVPAGPGGQTQVTGRLAGE